MRAPAGLVLMSLALAGAGCSLFGSSASRTVGEAVNTAQQTGDIVSGASAIATKLVADRKLAIARAAELYREAIVDERDLSKGPCLSNSAIPDWVVDVAHNPRTEIDDEPENQCAAFRAGTAHHFVELDLTGQLIQAL
jgi:hypothetical protein